MKTQIESTIRWIHNDIAIHIFNEILEACIISSSEDELRERIKAHDKSRYFAYGFGHNHMWVKQRKMSDASKLYNERLLFVEF